MIIYGIKATEIASEKINEKCSHCETENSINMVVFQKYLHIFWIPFVPSKKIGVMMHELRKELGMTQEQLAVKCGTTKNYISRIENNASDIRLSTLMRIFREGFGRQLKLSIG